ncbi:MAG: DUF2336 domain-containing protein [Proteobacteria bacterium]|nr:DUF2336 domain-containing protein [Pseudomonadota bacterium]
MSDLAGQSGFDGGVVAPVLAPATASPPRKAIGADRFRALTERLKKPVEPVAVAPAMPAAPAPIVAAPAPVITEEPLPPRVAEAVVAEAVVVEPVLDVPPPEEPVAEAVVQPAPAEPEIDVPAAPVVVAEMPQLDAEPAAPVEEAPVQAVLPEPPVPAQPAPTIFGSSPFAKMEKEAVEGLDSLQRRLSGLFSSTPAVSAPASALQFPEILPPPPPPPPPEPVQELDPGIVAPSMEEVQQRLREDATARLEQLDLENVWRQVLSLPTVEERAQYLKEAEEFAALQGIAVDRAVEIPVEHDLSRIEPEPPAEVAEEPAQLPEGKIYTPQLPAMSSEEAETAEVARSLLDMMSSGSSAGLPQERALAADTLLRLVPKLALKPLIMLAERLSIMENPPHLIVGKLLRDPRPEVSGPLLENCMHISENDLIMVAQEENPGKRRMLARRRKLSPAVSGALIATHDPSVILTLVRNAQAEISHDGFAALIDLAGDMPDVLAPLSTRADLAAPYAFELFWKAPSQLRRFLLNRFLTDSETLTKILKITLSTQGEDNSGDRLSLGEMVETLSNACKGKVDSAAAKFAEALQVGKECVLRILSDRAGEAIVVMLKVAGFSRGNLGDLLKALKRGDLPLLDQDRDIDELQVMFDTLSSNKARILLTYWDWAVKKSGPYAPVH